MVPARIVHYYYLFIFGVREISLIMSEKNTSGAYGCQTSIYCNHILLVLLFSSFSCNNEPLKTTFFPYCNVLFSLKYKKRCINIPATYLSLDLFYSTSLVNHKLVAIFTNVLVWPNWNWDTGTSSFPLNQTSFPNADPSHDDQPLHFYKHVKWIESG